MKTVRLAAVGLGVALAMAASAAPAAEPRARDEALWTAAKDLIGEQTALLGQIVNIDSGTSNAEGGRIVAEVLTPKLKKIGMTVQRVPAEADGLADNLVARIQGQGRGRILMIGHLDTVFEKGEAARRPFRVNGDRAYGPGVADEKGGVVQGLMALRLLSDAGFTDFAEIVFLIESSEEMGSPGSRQLIDGLLTEADVELNLEPGDAPDSVTVWRKGSATYTIAVKGRAAHAGIAPEEGHNAAVELINQLRANSVFPTSGTGLTANITTIKAGVRHNIIPDAAEAQINVRVRDMADFARVEKVFQANADKPRVPGTTVTVTRRSAYPAMPLTPATEELANRAAAIYGELGLTLGRGGNGGASESALAAYAGVPALDGLGPVGGGSHSEDEYLELNSLTPRLYLLARLLMELGAGPPPR